MLPYSPRYSDRSCLPGWPAMSGKRAGKPRYRLGVSQGGCGTGSVLRLGREWNRRFHEGPPSWLSEVATAACARWRRCQSSRWLATPCFGRIAVPRRRACVGVQGTDGHRPPDFRGTPRRGGAGSNIYGMTPVPHRNRRVCVRDFRRMPAQGGCDTCQPRLEPHRHRHVCVWQVRGRAGRIMTDPGVHTRAYRDVCVWSI